MKLKNKIRGLKAKREGDKWEMIFEHLCRMSDVGCVRIPNGCRRVGRRGLVQVKSPFDYIIDTGSLTICVDLKSYSKRKNVLRRSDINENQIEQLGRLRNTVTGYLVWFRDSDDVVFFPTALIQGMSDRESVEGFRIGSSSILDFDLLS